MKFNFEISNIEVAGVKLGGVKINTELSINEMVAIRQEQERALSNIPTYLEQLAEGMRTFEKLDKEFTEKQDAEAIEGLVTASILNKIARQINNK